MERKTCLVERPRPVRLVMEREIHLVERLRLSVRREAYIPCMREGELGGWVRLPWLK